MSITTLLASSRSNGNTRALLELALPAGSYALEDFNSLKIAYYSYEPSNEPDDFLSLIERMLVHDTWVIATPLYWYSMSAQTKTFLDRLSELLSAHKTEGRKLRGKTLAVLCSGSDPALPASFDAPFALTCAYLGMQFLGSHYAQFDGLRPVSLEAVAAAQAFGRQVQREISA